MRGSVSKRCNCGTVRNDAGKRVKCPQEHRPGECAFCGGVTNEAGRRVTCRKSHGSWYYKVDVGRDPVTGKRRQDPVGGFASKADAQKALNSVIAAVNAGTHAHDGGETLAQYLPTWLDRKVADGMRPTTEDLYRGYVRRFLIPQMGRVRLRDIRPGHVSALLDEVAKVSGSTTVRRVHATLRSALASALRQRKVPYNAAVGVELPTIPRTRVKPWEPDELGAFLDHAASDRLGPMFELLAMTGLRRGEALGLRWQDVDAEKSRLIVRQQLVALAGTGPACPCCNQTHRGRRFQLPKTDSGVDRVVELNDGAVGTLAAHRLAQDLERAHMGEAYLEHDLVFALEDGTPYSPRTITARTKELCDEAGLRYVKVHGLRHGHASLMLASGADIAVVSKRLGHSTIAVTVDCYSHLLEGVGRAAANEAAALVPRKPRDQSVPIPAESSADRQEVDR